MRHFGISVLYQLAFTLENEWKVFQANFVAWVLVVFQYLLIHNGVSCVATVGLAIVEFELLGFVVVDRCELWH